MKVLLTGALIFIQQVCLSQMQKRLENFQGFTASLRKAQDFEGEGYDIFIRDYKWALDSKGVLKIKRKLKIKKELEVHFDSELKISVCKQTTKMLGANGYLHYYLIPVSADKTTVIAFHRLLNPDINLERQFVKLYMVNTIPSTVYANIETDSIDFVGRIIELGSACRWMRPHNVQCPNYGQVSWAIFDTLSLAEKFTDRHFEMTKQKRMVKVITEESILVKFEGVETKAKKVKLKFKMPRFIMGGSNELIAYYVTCFVRGKYVSCIMSQYTNDSAKGTLAPLIAEVLTLPNPDGSWPALIKKDSLQEGRKPEPADSVREEKHDSYGLFRFENGIWIPMGNLRSRVGAGPVIGVHLPLIAYHHLRYRFDVLLSVMFPLNRQEFEYRYENLTFNTKFKSFGAIFGLLATRKQEIKNCRFINYIDQTAGFGVCIFNTTTKKPKNNPQDKDEYYDLQVPCFSLGVLFRKTIFEKKSCGLHIKYNLIPYTWFKTNVQKGFGMSSLTASLMISL